MGFKDFYTTNDLFLKSPVLEKDKITITNDTYALCELLESVRDSLNFLRSRM